MGSCCSDFCSLVNSHFDGTVAEGDLKRYRRRGPNLTTRLLRDMVAQAGGGKTLIDVGGGIGALSIELLTAGIEHATIVEAAPAYSTVARREAERRGQAKRMTMLQGDFATIGSTIPAADVVVMDRVVCCYPEFQPLLEEALRHSRRLFAFSYPRDVWYIRGVATLQNAVRTFRHNSFRFMVHPAAAMEALAGRQGFSRVMEKGTFVWSVEIYARKDADVSPTKWPDGPAAVATH